MTGPSVFPALAGHQYMLLTTFRRNGTAVPTPVWFAADGERLVMLTFPGAGKVKRIRNNPAVTVAPCTVRGEVLGPGAAGTARVLPGEDGNRAQGVLQAKYGLAFWLFSVYRRLRGISPVYLEIVPA